MIKEGHLMEELNRKELENVSGGTNAEDYSPHCPKCQSRDLELAGPVDIGTPPCYRCRSCGYEWMMAL